MNLCNINIVWLALGACLCACAPETPTSAMTTPAASAAPAQPTAAANTSTPALAAAAKPSTPAPTAAPAAPAAPIMTAAPAAPAPAPSMAGGAAPAVPPPAVPPAVPPAAPGNKEAPPAGGPPMTPPAAGMPGAPAAPGAAPGGGAGAEGFCAKYEKNCKYGGANRHADKAACVADFNGAAIQQGCKNMHIDTAIAGTAAACNGMPSEFCFGIHCLHAAGIVDQTGVTYCK